MCFMPKVTLHNQNQMRITIPSALCKALGIRGGDMLLFNINSRGRLELIKQNIEPAQAQFNKEVDNQIVQ